MALKSSKSRPVTAASTTMGVPNAPYATGAVLAINEKARSGERLESQTHQDGRSHGDRRAESGRALEERAEAERNQQQLQPAIVRNAGDALLQDLEQPGVGGELVHEDHVEDDPADRQQPEEPTQERRLPGHLCGHAIDEDRYRQRDEEPEDRRPMGLDVKEREAAQQQRGWAETANSVESHALPMGS